MKKADEPKFRVLKLEDTEEDFREHQANVFAAAIAMPRNPFREVTIEMAKKHGLPGQGACAVIRSAKPGEVFPEDRFIDDVAEVFGVSRTAARVQMQSRGLLVTEEEFEEQRNTLLSGAF